MRNLRRNVKAFKYAKPTGRRRIPGTTDWETTYTDPITAYANISSAKGDVRTQPFGDFEDYDKTIVDVPHDIDYSTVLWIDDQDTSKPHDYEVKRVAEAINVKSIAVKKVQLT